MLAVRWNLRFGLSYRDLEELLVERGVTVDHVTLHRWVQRFTPILIDAADPFPYAVGGVWFVDETYVKVSGVWRYVYRAIDDHGQVIDVYVSKRRDAVAGSSAARSVTTANHLKWSPIGPRRWPKQSVNWHRSRCTRRSSTRTIGSKPITAG